MTTEDPDRLRGDIERTQRNLSSDVNLLAEKVTPGQIVNRRVTRARRTMTSLRDRVMGTATDTMSTATDHAGDAASSIAQGVSEAPGAVRRGTEGNPLAAGLIAFGAGWLVSSLVPASDKEQQLAGQAKDWAREHGQPVADKAGQVAEQLKDNLREPAQDAVSSVRTTATDAASTVADETRSATSGTGQQQHRS
jgi:hypothetical protein